MSDMDKLRRIAEDLGKKGQRYWPAFPTPDLMGWLLHEGQCVYCGTNLIEIRSVTNALGTTDHLLPKGTYPELENAPLNLVPCCTGCNGIKRNWDPNSVSPPLYDRNTDDGIKNEKTQREFIERAKKYVETKRTEREGEFPADRAFWLEAVQKLKKSS